MRFESDEMHRKTRESEEARWRKPADDPKRQDQSSAAAKKPRTWLSRVIHPRSRCCCSAWRQRGKPAYPVPRLWARCQ